MTTQHRWITVWQVSLDEDVGANGLQSVRLAQPHSPFQVELQTCVGGAQCVDLVLLQELDCESQAAYSLEPVAWPRRGAAGCGLPSQLFSVSVLDASDHSPAFPQGAVEDAPVGLLFLDLDAADPQEGPMSRLLRLDPGSGRLILAGPVDYECQDTYDLDVIVLIRDVNDNAPDIAITPLATPGEPVTSSFTATALRKAVTGELRSRRCFDSEELAEMKLVLEALDGGFPPLQQCGC
ncbi:Hypothetical predicted protein, partial [Marmota monax]